jgi:hypothetical protein
MEAVGPDNGRWSANEPLDPCLPVGAASRMITAQTNGRELQTEPSSSLPTWKGLLGSDNDPEPLVG